MNAVIALCHFCEVHGPKVLFSCQPFHEAEERLGAGSPDSGNGSVGGTQSSPPKKDFYGSYDLLLRTEKSLEEEEQSQATSSSAEGCASCQSMTGSLPGFLTNDHEARISYVTSRYPYHPEISDMVRKACLRSLSCEVAPETEGPIFFGDDELHGYTLCHTFTLRDAKARGFQHFYSIVIVSIDKLLLLNSYDFLLKCLESVIDRLKRKANGVFEEEQQQVGTLRLATAGRACMLPSGFLKQRSGSGGSSRSLPQLTGDQHIFRFLHRYFVWILKAQTLRTVELVLEGCPTQDTLVRLEQLEEEEEEEKDSDFPIPFPHPPTDNFRLEDMDPIGITHKLPHACLPGKTRFAHSCQPYADLQELATHLGPDTFRLVGFRLLTGDQIVIRGENPGLIRQIIDALMCMIPRGCARVVYFSTEYREPFVCNLLGLDGGASLAEHVESGERNFLILSLVPCHEDADTASSVLGNYRFKVQTGAALPPALPKLLLRMEELVWEEKLSVGVLEELMSGTREEWVKKAKVFYQYSKQHPCPSSADMDKLMRVIRIGEADKDVVKFWQAGLSKQYKTYVLSACARLQHANRTASDKKEKE